MEYKTAFSTADRLYEHILLNNTIIINKKSRCNEQLRGEATEIDLPHKNHELE
jgi:hypothetical protein